MATQNPAIKPGNKILAYSIHLLTALGAVFGVWALIITVQGEYQSALWLLAVSVVIDSVDGTLARKCHVKELAPRIDGALLDNIVDYLTWTIVPLIWAFYVLHISLTVSLICVLASLFGFSNLNAKTSDHYFLGFPSYWNLVIFHLFILGVSPLFSDIVLIICSALVFIPLKWVYPSRTTILQKLTLSLSIIYAIQLIALVYLFKLSPDWLIYSSLIFPIYYTLLSFYVNIVTTS
ncbi:MAG TPA: CDP-alcohol phosphatidyltransferase family protein [Balneolales bacterium]|nr:CDP-alcohol phosphatidyltransferase family protein [Balneolales bacterium]